MTLSGTWNNLAANKIISGINNTKCIYSNEHRHTHVRQKTSTKSLKKIKTVKNVKISYKMTELGCPREERVNFGTQKDVLDGT